MELEFEARKKTEWALQRGGRSAHSFSWLLSSPQQPLETEDPPTVSLAPQYTSQHLCRAIIIFLHWKLHEKWLFGRVQADLKTTRAQLFHCEQGKIFSIDYDRDFAQQRIVPSNRRKLGLVGADGGPDSFSQSIG